MNPPVDTHPDPKQYAEFKRWQAWRQKWGASDVACEPTALEIAKRWLRGVYTGMKFMALIVFVAQIAAFTSFMYEEALQTAGFAARAAIEARDEAIAREAVAAYLDLMYRARAWQDRVGKIAFWSDGAYRAYFWTAAEHQVAGHYAKGVARGLWPDSAARYKWLRGEDGQEFAVDAWLAADAVAAATARVEAGIPGLVYCWPSGWHPAAGKRIRQSVKLHPDYKETNHDGTSRRTQTQDAR